MEYLPTIPIMLAIIIYWRSKFDKMKTNAAEEIDRTRQRYEVMLSEKERALVKQSFKTAMATTKPEGEDIKNPFYCTSDGVEIIITHLVGEHLTSDFITAQHAKQLWKQILVALIEVGEFASYVSEEDKKAMVDAAIKVKNEL